MIIPFLLVVVFGCEQQTMLSESVHICDDENPKLPAYTEWGYNTFGANYDRSIFVYTEKEVPLKVISENSNLSLLFQGIHGDNYYYSEDDYMALKFTFADSPVEAYQDLLVYNDTIIDLERDDVRVEIITHERQDTLIILGGELNFKRSQKIFVDDVEQQIVLSGTFELQFLLNDIPSTMREGRFDLGIKGENFYKLN